MNRDRAKVLLPIFEAYANGDDIESYVGSEWRPINGVDVGGTLEYRIKPKAREFWIAWDDGDNCAYFEGAAMINDYDHCIKVREVLE